MNTAPPPSFEDASRADARACAQGGVASLARAFNHCDRADVAHRYTDAEQSRFHALAVELVGLVEHGAIEVNPAHAQYPREIARAAIGHNAAAVILAHNHPSGETRPSKADEVLTQGLKSALDLIGVRVLDHFIVTGRECRSMAELGLV